MNFQLPLLLTALALVPSPSAASAATHTVAVRDDFYSPRTVTVRAGDTVSWAWRGRHKHNVASLSFGDSGNRRRGSYAVRFRRTGRYTYYCFLHDGMNGTVVVRR